MNKLVCSEQTMTYLEGSEKNETCKAKCIISLVMSEKRDSKRNLKVSLAVHPPGPK